MTRVCTVCNHPERGEIDSALVAASSSLRNIAERYGISATALHRHKKAHLPAALVKAKAAEEVTDADDLLAEVQRLQTITLGILGRAAQSGDLRTALGAIREARGNLELQARMVAAAMLAEGRTAAAQLEQQEQGKGPVKLLYGGADPDKL